MPHQHVLEMIDTILSSRPPCNIIHTQFFHISTQMKAPKYYSKDLYHGPWTHPDIVAILTRISAAFATWSVSIPAPTRRSAASANFCPSPSPPPPRSTTARTAKYTDLDTFSKTASPLCKLFISIRAITSFVLWSFASGNKSFKQLAIVPAISSTPALAALLNKSTLSFWTNSDISLSKSVAGIIALSLMRICRRTRMLYTKANSFNPQEIKGKKKEGLISHSSNYI